MIPPSRFQQCKEICYLERTVTFGKESLRAYDQKIFRRRVSRPPGIPDAAWNRRHFLFSRFDMGVEMDAEAWFEVTPENVAQFISSRIPCVGLVIDACCGVGGNSIQFARRRERVLGIDSSGKRIAMASKNASIYGVKGRIDFVHADVNAYLQELGRLANACFYCSPPWGGMECYNSEKVTLKTMPLNMEPIVSAALNKCGRVVLHLPRNLDVEDLVRFLSSLGVKYFEIERIYYQDREPRLKFLLVYIATDPYDSLFSLTRERNRQSISPYMGSGRAATILANALIRANYLGRYSLAALQSAYLPGVTASPLTDIAQIPIHFS